MDVKAPLDAASYERLTGTRVNVEKIRASMEIIKSRALSYEFRTTYVPALHTREDLSRCAKPCAASRGASSASSPTTA